jgi:chromosome segregation ATPase
MLEQFDKLDNAIAALEDLVAGLRADNAALRKERDELKNIITDRDLEIMQLQEDEKTRVAASEDEKADMAGRLEGLLGRMGALSEDKGSSDGEPQQQA